MPSLAVLVVDDETGMRMAVSRALKKFTITPLDSEEEHSFDIDQADCGEAALEMLAKKPYDIVLLDHKMPGISGLDVLAEIAKKEYDCLTIMITAFASLETAIDATKRGAFDFLAKPFTPAELKADVRKAAQHLIVQRKARQLEEEKKKVRFNLTSVVAHELKAPLGAIEGYLYLLRDRPAGDNLDAYEQAISRSITRLGGMRKLITDLLDLTRLESGQKKRDFKDLDLVEMADMAADTVRPAAEDRGIAIAIHAPNRIPFHGDPGEIEIIMNNLMTNAVKYNRDGGRVDVTLSDEDDLITISVADTGIGMSEDEVARLFNEFVRIKNKKTRGIEGTGLGLTILKRNAQLYGGDVTVTSRPDEGSTFTATLRRDHQSTDPSSEQSVNSDETATA